MSQIHLGAVRAVDGIGNIVYAGVNGSLNIYNVYRRDYPQLMNSISGVSSNIIDIIVDDKNNRLYMLTEKDGMYILDISEPYAPFQIGRLTPGKGRMIDMDLYNDSLVYIAGDSYVAELLVKDPRNIIIKKYTNLVGCPTDIDAHDGKLYIALGESGLGVLSVSYPDKFIFLGSQVGNYTMAQGYANNVIYGRLDTPKPDERRIFTNLFTFPFSHPITANVVGDIIYSGGINNFAIYELDPITHRDPKVVWNLQNMPTFDSELKDNYLYLANGWKGLSVYDVKDHKSPVELGRINTFGSPLKILHFEDILYVVAGRSGVLRYNLSDKEHPILLENLNIGNIIAAWDIAEYNGLIYVLGARNDSPDNVFVEKINPDFNEHLDEYPVTRVTNSDAVTSMEFGEKFCAISLGYNGIELMRIENGDLHKGYTITKENAQFYDVEFKNDFLYASDFHGSYHVYRLNDSSSPNYIASIQSSEDGGNGIEIVDNYLLAADATSGLSVINISNPKNPVLENKYATVWGMDIKIDNDIAYMSDGRGKLKVFDISRLPELSLIDSLNHGGYWTSLYFEDNYLYSIDMYNGVYIYQTRETEDDLLAKSAVNNEIKPFETGISGNYPNPFNSATEITFSVKEKTSVDVSIYNILGKKMETLISDNLPAGEFTLRWETGDSPSGVYLVVMQAGDERYTKKIEYVK